MTSNFFPGLDEGLHQLKGLVFTNACLAHGLLSICIVASDHFMQQPLSNYHQVSNIRRTLAGIWIVDHSDVVRASPVGAAPTTSSFST